MMTTDVNRRKFMGSAVATGVLTIVPRHVLGGAAYVPPSAKVTLAHIGMGTQGFREIGGLLADPEIRIVAVCDPNTKSNDYVEWGRNDIRNTIRALVGNSSWGEGQSGCPGGREVGREVVDAYYANQKGAQAAKSCRVYADFRELLDQEKDLDAVKIMTPDHLHATVAVAAMKKGKHVLVHKPLANRMQEGRLVVETARQTKVATHLLAYGAGAGNAAIAQRVKEGVIGPLREIHSWTNRPVWPQYTEIPRDRPPVPKGLDWDLWLGPALDRPYHPHYTHTVFRGWYDFGGGSMADMGIYALWPVFTALDLGVPQSAEAWATHTCSISGNISRVDANDFSYPTACSIRFQFAAQADRPALDLFWYDGGMKPRLPDEILAQNAGMGIEGILFVGDQGAVLAGFNGQNPQWFAKGRSVSIDSSAGGKKPRGPGPGTWVEAAKGGRPSPGNFLNAASITDTVNLGTVALRAGTKVLFDSQDMKITNTAAANKYLVRQYRKGWEL
ncbi:MAG: Gfo/Idh/MocA family protein [Thermoguttaceae bacterium]